MELLVIYLDLIAEDQTQTRIYPGLKPETIARLHHAKDILDTRLENPPSILELAQQVGVSDRTLQRGFPMLFNTTVTVYENLKQKPLWNRLNAVQQGQIYLYDFEAWNEKNPLAADVVLDDLYKYLVNTP